LDFADPAEYGVPLGLGGGDPREFRDIEDIQYLVADHLGAGQGSQFAGLVSEVGTEPLITVEESPPKKVSLAALGGAAGVFITALRSSGRG
jgi:hypothetical protein